MSDHLPILALLIFFLAALLMPLAGMIHKRMPWWLSITASALATGVSVLAMIQVNREGVIYYSVGGWPAPIGIELKADPLSTFLSFVVGIIALLVLIHSRKPVERELAGREVTWNASAMLLLGGFTGIISTGDLFNLYVFLEISALASYALLGAGSPRSAVAAFRYLILGTLGASFYLIGLGFLFAQTGSLNMQDVHAILEVIGFNRLTALAVVFMVVGAGIKMALLPLHFWLPDVYTLAPVASTALVAPLGTKVAAYVIIRLLYDVFPVTPELLMGLLAYCGSIGIVWGSIMAIPQKNLKRMLAYSSVAQIGYIALGIGMGTAYGYIGAILHVLNHACMKACLFLVAANLEHHNKGTRIDALNASLRRELPVTSGCFVLAAISMIGLPPTAGFFSKWYLLLGSLEAHNWFFIAVILLSSLLNAVYFFRVIERMYLGGTEETATSIEGRGSALLTVPTVALALGILAFGLGNVFIVTRFIQPMASAYF